MEEQVCPHCKKPIYDDEATLCLFCGESLDRPIGVFGTIRYATPKVIFVAMVIALIVIFFLIYIL